MTDNDRPIGMGSAAVRVARIQATAETHAAELDLMKGIVGDFKEVLVELARASVSNPAIGWMVALVSANVAYRAKVIDDTTWTALFIGLNAAFAIDVALELESGFFSISKGSSSSIDLIKPVTGTVVQSPVSNQAPSSGPSAGLIAKLAGLLPKAGAAAEAVIPAGAV